jgi:hypothetical protein
LDTNRVSEPKGNSTAPHLPVPIVIPEKEQTLEQRTKKYTDKALEVINGIMEDVEAPRRARLDAAGMLLDRAWGKATQKHEMPEIITLQDTLKSIAAKERRYQEVVDAEIIEPPPVVTQKTELSWEDLI